jgi:DNA-binding PadR family transcriptional regulator
MRYLNQKQKKELTKLAILTLLMEPLYKETGAGEATISRDFDVNLENGNHYQNMKVLLPSMIEDGLIRREESEGKKEKPYFITDEGIEYLESARKRALFPELAPQKDWSTREGTAVSVDDIAGLIRTFPEFGESDDKRIQQVSQQLAKMMTPAPSR